MNSNYPSQEIWQDAAISMRHFLKWIDHALSAPVAYTGNRDINTELSIHRYQQGYARREELEEQGRRQQEALNKQLDIAASTQQNEMNKLYIQGGLDEMRKEYYRVSAGSEGPYSVYAKAAYKALCTKEKEEAPIRE